ncbi:MAG TPA: AAA family ATPase [Gammaproteobacteria bacterium]|nr:AAA family ATPase [Gammaproteobacteria bacterium]
MKLYSLKIKGFRQLFDTEILFGDATFLIGQNNASKTSVLAAIEYLLSDKKIPNDEFFHINTRVDGTPQVTKRLVDEIVLTAEFRNVPKDALTWRGFKGRLLKYKTKSAEDSGLRILYRKTFRSTGEVEIELREFKRTIKKEFEKSKAIEDFFTAGANPGIFEEYFPGQDKSKNLTAKQRESLQAIDELWDVDEQEESWFKNPGGIPGNVLSRLPRYLLIPAQDRADEITGTSGTLLNTLNELFKDVRDQSKNYLQAREFLSKLASELDPEKEDSEFGQMMGELNNVLGDVFPETRIYAKATLSDPDKSLRPSFEVKMSSNIISDVRLQGTGMIRAAVFALLRFRKRFEDKQLEKTGSPLRPLFIGFEEPEIYLHPHAANQMRDVIYDLSLSPSNQIACTTHSPYMIDLSKKSGQVLNHLRFENVNGHIYQDEKYDLYVASAFAFNTTDAYEALEKDEKSYVKMILKVDDYIARVFFAKNILIVEGDTEEIVIKDSLKRLSKEERNKIRYDWQIVKARGKAAIIPLIKYFNLLKFNIYVMHDLDKGVDGAEIFNEPIKKALGNNERLFPLENCVEDVLGYKAPSREKPFTAYEKMSGFGENWDGLPEAWRGTLTKIFSLH